MNRQGFQPISPFAPSLSLILCLLLFTCLCALPVGLGIPWPTQRHAAFFGQYSNRWPCLTRESQREKTQKGSAPRLSFERLLQMFRMKCVIPNVTQVQTISQFSYRRITPLPPYNWPWVSQYYRKHSSESLSSEFDNLCNFLSCEGNKHLRGQDRHLSTQTGTS